MINMEPTRSLRKRKYGPQPLVQRLLSARIFRPTYDCRRPPRRFIVVDRSEEVYVCDDIGT